MSRTRLARPSFSPNRTRLTCPLKAWSGIPPACGTSVDCTSRCVGVRGHMGSQADNVRSQLTSEVERARSLHNALSTALAIRYLGEDASGPDHQGCSSAALGRHASGPGAIRRQTNVQGRLDRHRYRRWTRRRVHRRLYQRARRRRIYRRSGLRSSRSTSPSDYPMPVRGRPTNSPKT